MLSVEEAFAKFKGRLEITEGEQDDASRRQQTIRKQVQAGTGVDRDFLTGSYVRATKTRPLKDVDIFVVLKDSERGYLDRPPRDVLDEVRRILVPHYSEARVCTERRSVRVDFGVRIVDDLSDKVVSFDVVPAFTDGEDYRIPDGRVGEWVATNPEVHKRLATSANEAFAGQWKPVVKMLKKWNNHNDRPIKPSFLIEVMALELLGPPWGGDYPYEIKQYFASAVHRLDEGWRDPAGLGPDVSDRMDTDMALMVAGKKALADAEATCTEALRQEQAGRTGAALEIWQGLFGPAFARS